MNRLVAALAVLACSAPLAHAQPSDPYRFRLTWENDLVAARDGHYTNGAAVALSGRLSPDLLPASFEAGRSEWELTLGQEIYTPRDTSVRLPGPDDRPYAGFAYVRLGALRWGRRQHLQDQIVLTLGIVGPASGAEAAQGLAHDLTGSSPAEGWAEQLRDEPVIGLSYALSPRLARSRAFGLDVDFAASFEVALGNVATYASAGATLRFGLHVPDEYAEPAPAPLRCYVTVRASVRAVAYDVFLDGNLLRSGGPSVRKHPLVAQLEAGLTFTVTGRVSLSYVHTYRTPQFQGQGQGDQFGSINLTFTW